MEERRENTGTIDFKRRLLRVYGFLPVSYTHLDVYKRQDVKCDICHYPIQFKTIYAENMPEKIPFSLLLSKSIFTFFEKSRLAVTIGLAAVLYIIGVPLVWNMFGKLYTMMLDGSSPYPGDLTKSLIYGYDRSATPESVSYTHLDVYKRQA